MPRIRHLFISQDSGPQIPAQIQTLVTMLPKPRVANYDKIQFLKTESKPRKSFIHEVKKAHTKVSSIYYTRKGHISASTNHVSSELELQKTKRINLYSCSHKNAGVKTDTCLNCLENTGLQKECILWQLTLRCEIHIQLRRKNTVTVLVKLLINDDLLLFFFLSAKT